MEKVYITRLAPAYLGDEEFEAKKAYVESKVSEIDFDEINRLGREWAKSLIEDEYFAQPGHRNDSGVDFVCAIQMASLPNGYDDGIEEKFIELWKERNPDKYNVLALLDVVERCKDYAESWGFRPYLDQESFVKVRKEERSNGDIVYWCQARSYKSGSHVWKTVLVPNPKGLYDVCKGNIGNYPDNQDIDMAYFDNDLGKINADMAKKALREVGQENSED